MELKVILENVVGQALTVFQDKLSLVGKESLAYQEHQGFQVSKGLQA